MRTIFIVGGSGAVYKGENRLDNFVVGVAELKLGEGKAGPLLYIGETRFVKVVFCKRISKEQRGCHTSFVWQPLHNLMLMRN